MEDDIQSYIAWFDAFLCTSESNDVEVTVKGCKSNESQNLRAKVHHWTIRLPKDVLGSIQEGMTDNCIFEIRELEDEQALELISNELDICWTFELEPYSPLNGEVNSRDNKPSVVWRLACDSREGERDEGS
ncbi:MAG: hypothetical protein ABEN55_03930 [Bradymonadaceae bacterium]